ncbi:MAG: hypothetical protein JXB50_02235 [Spirochaetes bacterium]|nr:hypothetical protein [Spirochaetota bacterium]
MNEENKEKLPKDVLQAKEKGFQVIALESSDVTFYFRKPTSVEIKRFFDEVANERGKLGSRMDSLVRSCRLYPSSEEYEKLLSDKPGLFVSIYNAIQEELGFNDSFLLKKL